MAHADPHHEIASSFGEELLSRVADEALIPQTTRWAGVLSDIAYPGQKAFERLNEQFNPAGLMSSRAWGLAYPNEAGRPPIVDVTRSFTEHSPVSRALRSPLSAVVAGNTTGKMASEMLGGYLGGPLSERVGGSVGAGRFLDVAGALSGLGTAWDLGSTVSGLSGLVSRMPEVERGIFGLAQSFSLEALGVPEEVIEVLSALKIYEEGGDAPLLALAAGSLGRKLSSRERRRLKQEVAWFWECTPGEVLTALDHPERWLDRGAEERRVRWIRRNSRASKGDTVKALNVLALYRGLLCGNLNEVSEEARENAYKKARERTLMADIEYAVYQPDARLFSDEKLRDMILNEIKREAREEAPGLHNPEKDPSPGESFGAWDYSLNTDTEGIARPPKRAPNTDYVDDVEQFVSKEEARENSEHLAGVKKHLSELERLVLEHDLENHRLEDKFNTSKTAAELGKAVGTVKAIRNRYKAKLAKHLRTA